MNNSSRPDKRLLAQSFANAAGQYDDVAILQKQTGDEMIDRLQLVTKQAERILDLGAGTGRNTNLLAKRYPRAQVFSLDIAAAMLEQARKNQYQQQGLKRWLPLRHKPHYLVGDAEQLPLADNSIDLVFSNLTLQWCDPRTTFFEIQRVLRPDGLLMFTSLGPDTLTELRQSWAQVDDYQHVNLFYDMHDVGEAMVEAGLTTPVLDRDSYTLTYKDTMGLMRDLKTLGAHNVNAGRRRGLTGRHALQKLANAYESFREQDLLPATYEVIYGHAWGGQLSQQAQPDGSVMIPVEQIQRKITR